MQFTNTPVSQITSADGSILKILRVEIGAWNMDSDIQHNVEVPVDHTKIISGSGIVYNDAGTAAYPVPFLGTSNGGLDLFAQSFSEFGGNSLTTLTRTNTSVFNSAAFSSTGISRGFLSITYYE